MNTIDFIEEIKRKRLVRSDYAVAKLLGISLSRMSHYRNGRASFSDPIAIRAAQLLDLEPGYVLACIHAARAKDPEVMSAWQTCARKMAKDVAAVIFGISMLCLLSAPLHPAAAAVRQCILCQIRRRARWLAGALRSWPDPGRIITVS